MIRLLGAIVVACVLAAPARGVADPYDTLAMGPRVGEKIPLSLSARDQHGKRRDIQSLMHRRGLVLLFSRSLDW